MIETRANAKTAKVFKDLENDTQELMDIDNSEPATPELSSNEEVKPTNDK